MRLRKRTGAGRVPGPDRGVLDDDKRRPTLTRAEPALDPKENRNDAGPAMSSPAGVRAQLGMLGRPPHGYLRRQGNPPVRRVDRGSDATTPLAPRGSCAVGAGPCGRCEPRGLRRPRRSGEWPRSPLLDGDAVAGDDPRRVPQLAARAGRGGLGHRAARHQPGGLRPGAPAHRHPASIRRCPPLRRCSTSTRTRCPPGCATPGSRTIRRSAAGKSSRRPARTG